MLTSDVGATPLDVVRDLLDTRGVRGFYHGVGISALHNVVEKFLYFFAYTGLRA